MATTAAAESNEDYVFADEEPRSEWARIRHRFFQHRLAAVSLFLLVAVFVVSLLASKIAPYGYLQLNITDLSEGPSWAHPFGTDQIGRDYFSRVLYGMRTEIQIVLVVAVLGTAIGMIVGGLCGFYGRSVDNILMRGTDLFLTLPPLIWLLVAVAYLHVDTLPETALLFACILWMPLARIARGACLSIREREFVEAARAMGASDWRIIRRHILPNAVGIVIVAATVLAVTVVILETTISYLGRGITIAYFGGRTDTTMPSLGDVLAAATGEGLYNWWGIVFPGIAVVLIIAPIMAVGDGIRDAFDPAQARRKITPRKRRKRRRKPTLATRISERVPRPTVPPLRLRERLPKVSVPGAATARRLVVRPRRRTRLVLEAVGVLLVTAVTAGAVYVFGVDHAGSRWPLRSTAVRDVSQASGVQIEATIATSPTRRNALFAASNDSLERTIRVYESTDDGASWFSEPGPQLGLDACARGEPSAAVGADGREYVAFVVNPFCTQEEPYPYLAVASRAPGGSWRTVRVPPKAKERFDAKPSLAAAPDGRVYAAWTRLIAPTYATTVVSSTADGGRTWSAPRVVSPQLEKPQLVSVAASPSGTVYVAGVDVRHGIWLAMSVDGGRSFRVRRVASLGGSAADACATAGRYPTAFEANHCLGPNPTVVANRDRVLVVYSGLEPNGTRAVFGATFRPRLEPAWHGRIGPADESPSDQFWPAAAADPATGRFWACYYDTGGDPGRRSAWYACTRSNDGRQWATPVGVGEAAAKADVLWEDARIYGYGDTIGFGGYTALAVREGTAHPMWIDTRNPAGRLQEVYTARLDESAFKP